MTTMHKNGNIMRALRAEHENVARMEDPDTARWLFCEWIEVEMGLSTKAADELATVVAAMPDLHQGEWPWQTEQDVAI